MLSAIFIVAIVVEDEKARSSLSVPESLLLPLAAGSVATGGFLSSSPDMEREKWERREQ
jgi:hypothetical protein